MVSDPLQRMLLAHAQNRRAVWALILYRTVPVVDLILRRLHCLSAQGSSRGGFWPFSRQTANTSQRSCCGTNIFTSSYPPLHFQQSTQAISYSSHPAQSGVPSSEARSVSLNGHAGLESQIRAPRPSGAHSCGYARQA